MRDHLYGRTRRKQLTLGCLIQYLGLFGNGINLRIIAGWGTCNFNPNIWVTCGLPLWEHCWRRGTSDCRLAECSFVICCSKQHGLPVEDLFRFHRSYRPHFRLFRVYPIECTSVISGKSNCFLPAALLPLVVKNQLGLHFSHTTHQIVHWPQTINTSKPARCKYNMKLNFLF